MKELIKEVLIALAIVLCITAVIKPTIVRGSSMEPSLNEGDYLIVNKLAYCSHSPRRGDIIVLKNSNSTSTLEDKLLIKRVCAIAGDDISIDGSVVSVNGAIIDEHYLSNDPIQEDITKKWDVPQGCVFVMGDHRSVSLDSRSDEVGFIEENDIVGRAIVRLYPFSQITCLENPFTQ